MLTNNRTIAALAEPQFIEVRFMAPGGGVVSSMTVKIDQGIAPEQRRGNYWGDRGHG